MLEQDWKKLFEETFPGSDKEKGLNWSESYFKKLVERDLKYAPVKNPKHSWQQFYQYHSNYMFYAENDQIEAIKKNIIDVSIGTHATGVLTGNLTLYGAVPGIVPNDDRLREDGIGRDLQRISKNVTKVSCGSDHLVYITTETELFGCGKNTAGELGVGDRLPRTIPTLIETNIYKICASQAGTFYIDGNSDLYFMGLNLWSRAGLPYDSFIDEPEFVANDVKHVSSGNNHTAYINKYNQLFTAGRGTDGQLGQGQYANSSTFIGIADDIKSVSCGQYHTGVVTLQNELYLTGSNKSLQII